MEGLFVVGYASLMEGESGIGKKILNQIDVFNYYGLNCKLYVQKSGREHLPTHVGQILYALPFTNVSPKWEYDEAFNNLDYIYMRRPIAVTYSMRSFLKKCKNKNPKLKIYMEIPTYPYDDEYRSLFQKYNLQRDKWNRKRLKGLVDCVFVIDPMDLIDNFYGLPTVKFLNGYDTLSNIPISYKPHGDIINLTCVGMFNFWHGYERLICGLSKYYAAGGKRNIHIQMVGDGVELANYKRIVQEEGLEDKVTFHGKLFGEALDEVYRTTDLGISSLGRYKNNIQVVGDLKTREYIAKGIPSVSGCTVDIFKGVNDFPYYLEVPNNPAPIDIEQLLAFCDTINNKRKESDPCIEMHQYALDHFDIKQTMKPVMDYIKNFE